VELSLNVLQRLHKIFRSHKGPAAEAVTVEMTMLHRGSHVLEYATEYNQKVAVDRLKQAGIMVKTGTSVEAIVPSSTTTSRYSESIGVPPCQVQVTSLLKDEGSSSSSFLDADLVLWTAGAMRRNIPNVPGILNSKIPRDTKGRIVTDSYLKVKGSTSNPIFALGDCSRVVRSSSSPPHQILKPYPATAQVALQQATVVAWNVYSQTMNATEDILPFEYLDLGEMMSLGSEDASISSLQGKLQLEGKSASLLRRWIYALRMPTPRQALTALQSSFQQRLVQKKKYE
jgi:NADH:ubiquinone reductase (non-electrogenic)